ncbi:GIGYF family protein Gyf [Euwallacea similis]|uniref:GIGYF family protein Gyf n=1 Tax=Euwallacea similis TaxID=1736056 RepID=UPI00344EB658
MRDNLQFGCSHLMLIAFSKLKNGIICSMTDSMNFGPDWIRNLSSEGNAGGGAGGGGQRCQLADYRYGREEMLALFDRNIKPPASLANFKTLYSDTTLLPLALLPTTEEEAIGGWQGRPLSLSGAPRGRGTSLDRGGRGSRGRGGYQTYGRPNYEGAWGNGETSDWSPRKEYSSRPSSMDNWRRGRDSEEGDGWRMSSLGRGMHEKWGRQSSWRGDGEEERTGPPERGGRWADGTRGPNSRRSWESEDHLPEWATENPVESGGSFDDRGAFHGSDDEHQSDGGKSSGQKKDGLHKSTSQQHISHKTHPPLLTSKSTMSLTKDIDYDSIREDKIPPDNQEYASRDIPSSRERKLSVPEAGDKPKDSISNRDRAKSEGPLKSSDVQEPKIQDKAEDNDFEKLQEAFISKLVVDEDPPKQNTQVQPAFEMPNLAPPPNLSVPGQDKWFYQDPQGQMQGPFTNMEMSEWFKAGYFGQDLKVRRQCDERFFLLGELMAMCNSNPFQTSMRFPVLKNDISKMSEPDRQYPFVPQMQAFKQAQARVLADPWSAIAVQQQEIAAQRLILQQQQVPQDLQYVQQHPPVNPLMHMISQMQQANKLPPSGLIDKQPPNLAAAATDPHLHMPHFLSMQNRLPGTMPNALPTGMPGPLPPDNLAGGLPGIAGAGIGAGHPLQSGLSDALGLTVPTPQGMDPSVNRENDPIAKLLKQLQEKQQQQNLVESFWQHNQFGTAPPVAPPQQWPNQIQPEVPLSMWDVQQPPPSSSPAHQKTSKPLELSREPEEPVLVEVKAKKPEKTKENKQKDDEKELKKKKKAEEEQQKKEAEEKRKLEQKKLEAERKAEIDRKKKEEERIKKELEKAKKEAEEKRLRELEEKRKLKEQRKLEEEAKKRSDEDRKKIEDERIQREKEQREREERQRAEERRLEQLSLAKAAPWSQANSTFGMSLTEIQKAEKERKAQEAALQAQRAQERELQLQQQQSVEKPGGIQLGWAKAMEPRKVKSLAEIQAEEQERLAKEAAEARLKKEKESREAAPIQQTNTIWSGQSLSWASASSQWSSSATTTGGFWDEPAPKPQPIKPSNVAKSNSMSTINSASKQPPKQQQSQQQKPKAKKEEATASKKNHNNNVDDEFTNWCFKALSSIDTNVDVPTFVTFLRDIESAFEVREYCRMYLGENNATQQFTNNFLEKRRSFKPKNAHKDDMCSPAPAITPSMHNSTEFQEVKGKNKKSKKSKMLKVDSRILGFNVTSAPDRINVGDRDYGDNS